MQHASHIHQCIIIYVAQATTPLLYVASLYPTASAASHNHRRTGLNRQWET